MTETFRDKARVHIQFEAEYAGVDHEGYHKVRCYDQHNVYLMRVPRNATLEAVDHAYNDPIGTVRHEEYSDGAFVQYRKTHESSETANGFELQPWLVVEATRDSLGVVGHRFTDEFVDEFPRVTP